MREDNQFSKVLKINAERYAPCATRTIPYGHQLIDEEDIQAVVEVLRSDWLTTGPKVAEFEQAFAGNSTCGGGYFSLFGIPACAGAFWIDYVGSDEG